MSTPSDTLASLAMLKVDYDVQQRDYVDYLLPFVIHVLGFTPPEPVTDAGVRDQVEAEFGLHLPVSAAQLVLRRLSRKGYLNRSYGVYHIGADLPTSEIPARRAEAGRHIDRVVNALRKYAEDEFDEKWKPDEAISAILAFLSRFSIECLRTYTHGTALPKPGGGPRTAYIASAFIRSAYDTDRGLFDSLIVCVKGYMLSNALLCPDLESLQRKFGRVTFFLDTPLVLRLLRLQGEEEFNASKELIDLVKKLDGTLGIFHHTAEEVHGVIRWCEGHLDKPRATGPIIREMRRQGKTRSDLALVRGRLDKLYAELGISRRRTPKYDPAFQIDEAVLQDAIEDEIRYMNPRALLCDINSIRSIYAFRKGQAPIRLEDAPAVLVTSNAALAHAAFEFGKEHESSREVSTVISGFSLANTAWLKAPIGAPDLPACEVLAVCYSAMEPGRVLWVRYIEEIDKLKKQGELSADDHAILRYSLRAKEELMDLTLGQEVALSAGTVTQILDRVKQELVEEHVARLSTEEAAHAATIQERDRLATERELIEKRLFWRAASSAKYAANGVFILLATVIAAGGAMSALLTTPFVGDSYVLTGLVNCVGLVFIVWSVSNLVFGVTVRGRVNCLENHLRRRIFKRLRRDIIDPASTCDAQDEKE